MNEEPDLILPPSFMISSQGEASNNVYRKIEGNRYNWFIPPVGPNRASRIYCDTKNKNSRGMAGATITFHLEDGTNEKVIGPWCSNSDDLLSDTGVDLTQEHVTRVIIASRMSSPDGYTRHFWGVVYQEPEEGIEGHFDRYKSVLEKYPHGDYYWSVSKGGAHGGLTPEGRKRWEATHKSNL